MCKPEKEGGMSFKDLALFNDVLAKQAWRLLYNKESLFYKVFKSKFFPHCSVLDAKENSRGSYAWRSILKCRDVLKRGVRWRVGTSESINLWVDLWLPSLENPRLQSPFPKILNGALVVDLINPLTKQWNLSLKQNLFLLHKVSSILSIPLCKNQVVDKVFWPLCQSGLYAIKFGFQFLVEEQQNLDVDGLLLG